MNKHLRLPLILAGVLLVGACGGDSDTSSGEPTASLPDTACADLGVAKMIEQQLGGKAETLSEKVTEDGDITRAQCVWNTPAPDRSVGGATVEVVIEAAPRSDLSKLWETAAALGQAPSDWRPQTAVQTESVTPPGEWEEAEGYDFSHPIAGADATRLLNFRVGRAESYVARVAVRMDAKGGVTPATAKLADQALTAAAGVVE